MGTKITATVINEGDYIVRKSTRSGRTVKYVATASGFVHPRGGEVNPKIKLLLDALFTIKPSLKIVKKGSTWFRQDGRYSTNSGSTWTLVPSSGTVRDFYNLVTF